MKLCVADAHQDNTFAFKDATAYFGDTEDTDLDTTAAENLAAVRYFNFGGATVGLVQSVEATTPVPVWAYLFGDYQGSAQAMMTAAESRRMRRSPATRAPRTGRSVPTTPTRPGCYSVVEWMAGFENGGYKC